MIGAFPDLYPDEMLVSAWARYEDWVRYPQRRSLLEELFGYNKANVTFDLPDCLNFFCSALPPGHPASSPQRLAIEHTLLPFYSAFLPTERIDRIYQKMCGEEGVNIHMLAGLSSLGHLLPKTLRYCPVCVSHDRDCFGETYWHRVHQLAGVLVCPHHAVWLEDSNVAMWIIPGSVTFTTAESVVETVTPRFPQRNVLDAQQLLTLAQAAHWILTHPEMSAETFRLKDRSLLQLVSRGLATHRGHYQQSLIMQAFKTVFPTNILAQIYCSVEENARHGKWLTHLLRKDNTGTFALYGLLLILFLAEDIPTFLALPVAAHPFGTGPWPCLNPACEQDGKLCIPSYELDYNHKGLPRGTFTCTTCDFIYSRIGPDSTADDLYRIGAIKDHGALWETKLLELWFDPDVTIRHMVAVLRSSWSHLRRQGTQLNLPFPPPGVRSRRLTTAPMTLTTDTNSSELTKHREAWLTVLQQHPDWGVKELRNRYLQLHSWLRYHDREWLLQQSPPRKKQSRQLNIDWQQRDAQFSTEIEAIYVRLMATQKPLFRVSANAILTATGRRTYYTSNRYRLPQAVATLERVAESYEDFAIRRVWDVARQLHEEGIVPRRRLIAERASVDAPPHRNNLHVQAVVDAALDWLKEV